MPKKIPDLGGLDALTLLAVYQDARSRLIPKVKPMLARLAEETRALEALEEELAAEVAAEQSSSESQDGDGHGDGDNPRLLERRSTTQERSPRVSRKIEPKYRNSKNPSETWAGRGLPPRWLVAYERTGRKREEFLVRTPPDASEAPPLPGPSTVPQVFSLKSSVSAVLGADAFTEAFKMLGSTIRFDRNQEIQAEGEPALYFYQVVSGAVRTYKLLSDGRRQISSFQLPGDVVELGTAAHYCFSAEAISPSTLRFAKRSAVIEQAGRNSDLAVEIWRRTAKHLQTAQEHMVLLGRKNADERLASFLLEMADRCHADSVLELPMSRQDIADYLGLTIETVSRILTHLESCAAIRREGGRRLELHNRAALGALNA
jgi:CRP-like cAMP-binding protein/DNA-binding protein H-NS